MGSPPDQRTKADHAVQLQPPTHKQDQSEQPQVQSSTESNQGVQLVDKRSKEKSHTPSKAALSLP